MKVAQDFLALLKKNNKKNKYEKVFSSESKEQQKNEQKLLRIWGDSSPPQYLTLYAKVFFSNFNYLFYSLYDSGVILKELGCKERGTAEGVNPLIYVIKHTNTKVRYLANS